MNTKRKGSIAVGKAISYFMSNGSSVFLPVSDCDKYDLVIEKQAQFQRIQCKYSNDKEKSGAYIIDLRTFGGYREKTYHTKYIENDFDELYVFTSDEKSYLIPAKLLIGKSQIAVGKNSWIEYLL
jgi:hypothetical protein